MAATDCTVCSNPISRWFLFTQFLFRADVLYIHTYIRTSCDVYTHTYTRMQINIDIHVHMRTYTHTHTHTHACIHKTYTLIAHTHTYTHIHIHTYTAVREPCGVPVHFNFYRRISDVPEVGAGVFVIGIFLNNTHTDIHTCIRIYRYMTAPAPRP